MKKSLVAPAGLANILLSNTTLSHPSFSPSLLPPVAIIRRFFPVASAGAKRGNRMNEAQRSEIEVQPEKEGDPREIQMRRMGGGLGSSSTVDENAPRDLP